MKKLVLAEKPSVGRDYAKILKCYDRKDGYMEGDNYIVTWGFGHLFTLKEPGDYNEKYKKWNFNDLPIIPEYFETKVLDSGNKQYKIIKKLIDRSDVNEIINGGDAGIEGEVIMRWILLASGTKKPVKRLWISTLTEEDIREGFNNLKDSKEFNTLYTAGKTRAEIDWLIGLNYTRAYTTKNSSNLLLSIGRVQTCILNLIKERDGVIFSFKPEPYKEIEAIFENYKGKYINENNESKIFDLENAEKIKSECENKDGKILSIENKEKNIFAPSLFNLTGLQKVMNSKFGFSAQKTLNVAQSLYEKHKILSYPRTSSKHLSKSFIKEFPIIFNCVNFGEYKTVVELIDINNLKTSKRFIDNTKISDHHAIVPTKNKNIKSIYNTLTNDEKNLFNEVVLRLLAQFFNPYKYLSTIVITNVIDKYNFKTVGKTEIDKGWKEIYTDVKSENEDDSSKLPILAEGEVKKINDIKTLSKFTKPPLHYNESSLLAELEKYSIGTEATRAGIIETLLKRTYIERNKKQLLVTKTGINLIDTLKTDSLKSVELTAEIEEKLRKIKNSEISRNEVIQEEIYKVRKEIEKIAYLDFEIEKDIKVYGKCPLCSSGNVVKSKYGYGCSNWKEENCKFSINETIAGKKLSENQIKQLIEKGKTSLIKGFVSKKDSKFEAKLKIDENKKVVFDFNKEEKEKITCPICKKGYITENDKAFSCSEWKSGCTFTIWREKAGKKITFNQLKQLLDKGKTGMIKGFKNSKGTYDAILNLDDNFKITFSFPEKDEIDCPICKKGVIKENEKAFSCSNWREGCKFTVWKNISGKNITKTIIKTLVKNGKTNKIKGFVSKNKKEYSAYLEIVNNEIKITF